MAMSDGLESMRPKVLSSRAELLLMLYERVVDTKANLGLTLNAGKRTQLGQRCWLKKSGNEGQQLQIIPTETSTTLLKISQLVSIVCKVSLPNK